MIYVKLPLPPAELAYLRQEVPGEELTLEQELRPADRASAARGAEIIFGNVPVDWLSDAPDLRWVQLSSAGFTPYSALAGRELSFTITNSAGIFGTPVAETALAGILALLREIPTFVEDKSRVHWRGAAIRPELGTLSGKRVLILGHGSIGGTFRQLLGGFSCSVETMGRRGGADFDTPEALDERLPHADVVVAALPETEETIQLFDARRMQLLSPNCILVNVGRGSLIDEVTLLAMLHADRLRGAVLDVTAREPLPADDPLWTAPRTLLTQHSAGGADNEHRRLVDRFLHNLRRYRAAQSLEYVVNLGRGY